MPTRIFLASSSELKAERGAFEARVNRKNKLWHDAGIFLHLEVWEDFIDAMSSTRLQDDYNAAIRAADIFVVLVHAKVGKFSAEEFDTAHRQFEATRRPLIYTYFRCPPGPGEAEPGPDYDAVRAFQSKLAALGHYPTAYESTDGLIDHFMQQLDKLQAKGLIRAAATATGPVVSTRTHVGAGGAQDDDADDARLALASHLQALATDLAGLRLGEIDASTDPSRQTPLQLPDIYVPLDTTFRLPEGKPVELAFVARDIGEMLPSDRKGLPKMRAATALEALASFPQLTLLGPPGSGKSTFGAHVLLTLAQCWLGQPKRIADLGEAWPHGMLLPVRVVLRRFAEQHVASSRELVAGDLWRFIGQDLHDGGWGTAEQAMVHVQRLARRHGALVLFDGLDECGDEQGRQRVVAAVQAFMRAEASRSRFLLTARPYAFPAGADPSKGIFALAEFDETRIERFIDAWFWALAQRGWLSDASAAAKRDELLAAYNRVDLLALARNPLLLTLMAMLQTHRGRLPDDRAQLYDETVDLLLQRWNRQAGADRALLDLLAIPALTLEHLRSALEELAFKVHEANAGASGAAEIGEDLLVRSFRPLLGGSKDKADQVVAFIERRAGLLLGQGERNGERQFTLPHRTIQEFLAACHLSALDDFATECRRLADADAGHWRVVLPLAARLAKAQRGATAADELVGGVDVEKARRGGAPTVAHWQRALLAGMQLKEIGVGQLALSERTAAVLDRVRGWLLAGLPLHPSEGGAPAAQRAQAGDVLAALGDPRFHAGKAYLPADDMLGFVFIPPDPVFCIGTRSSDRARVQQATGKNPPDDEINDTAVVTQGFWIARYPVTVAQFAAFVQATGQMPGDADALRDPGTRPVRWVNWHEALAYCEWLTRQIRESPGLASSQIGTLARQLDLRAILPSELEWEIAACGGFSGQIFSWGNTPDPQRSGIFESGTYDTSAVGCFGSNAFGLHDMLGNVWEWTRSPMGRYPYRLEDTQREPAETGGQVMRMVRGGSFSDHSAYTRCAFRRQFHPNNRHFIQGFRVLLQPMRAPAS